MTEHDASDQSQKTAITLSPKTEPSVQTVVVLNFSPKRVGRWVLLIAVVGLIPMGVKYFNQYNLTRKGSAAYGFMSQGFGALAMEWIDDSRESFVTSREGCDLLLRTYDMAFRIDRLQWTAEACMAAGIETSEVHQARGRVFESFAWWEQAKTEYEMGAFRIQSAKGIVRYSEFLLKHGTAEEAVASLEIGLRTMPGNDVLSYQLLKTFLLLKKYDQAARVALSSSFLIKNRKFPDGSQLITDALEKAGQTAKIKQLMMPPNPGMSGNSGASLPKSH